MLMGPRMNWYKNQKICEVEWCWRYYLWKLVRYSNSSSCIFSRVWLFCHPVNFNLAGFSVHGTFQARILEWVAISFYRDEPFWPRDPTRVSWVSCSGRGFFTTKDREKPAKAVLREKYIGLYVYINKRKNQTISV